MWIHRWNQLRLFDLGVRWHDVEKLVACIGSKLLLCSWSNIKKVRFFLIPDEGRIELDLMLPGNIAFLPCWSRIIYPNSKVFCVTLIWQLGELPWTCIGSIHVIWCSINAMLHHPMRKRLHFYLILLRNTANSWQLSRLTDGIWAVSFYYNNVMLPGWRVVHIGSK